MAISDLNDSQLYSLCKDYGEKALLWRRKFMGLLPKVERRRLYLAHDCSSVFEFAAKLAGLSEQQVKIALNLDKSFSDKPTLKALLESGEVSVHKLVRVQSVATPESESFWAEQAKVLPKKALETLVKEERSLPGQRLPLQLNDSVRERLEELQAKGLDVNTLLTEFLDKREEEIATEKIALAEVPSSSTYIPVAIRRVLNKEHGSKCSIPACPKPSQEIHHTRRFSITPSHDPHYLAPLCKEHHQLAHLVDQSYRELRAQKI